MTQAYAQLLETVHDTRRAWRTRRALEGLLLVAAVFIGTTAVMAMLDRMLAPGIGGRLVLALLIYGPALAVLGWKVIHPLTRHYSDDYFAALLEQRVPNLGNRLINAFQLGRTRNGRASSSPLVEAIISDGVQAADDVPIATATRSPAMGQHAIVLASSLLIGALFWFSAGPAAPVSLQRVLMPVASIAPFTWTQVTLELDPGQRVLEGRPVTVKIATTGRAVDEARVYWRDPEDQLRSAHLAEQVDGTFAHEFPSVTEPLTVYATAGDGRSATHTIAIDPRPRIEQMRATYNFPAYTGLADRHIDDFDGHLQAVRGTRVQLHVRSSEPLETMRLRLGDEQIRTGDPADAVGHVWSFALALEHPDNYRIQMHDQRGYEVESSRSYTIHPEHDSAPSIAFRQPRNHVSVPGDEPVSFEIVARDRFGLDRIELRGRLGDAEPRTLATWSADESDPTRMQPAVERTATDLEIPPGQRMTVWAVAWDRNDIAGPGEARTRRLTIHHVQRQSSETQMEANLADYVRVLTRLLRDQQRNRAETAEYAPATRLIERQNTIRRDTRRLGEQMEQNAFPAPTIITGLYDLAAAPMAETIVRLERYDEADSLSEREGHVEDAVALQDQIIDTLEQMLVRLTRAAEVRQRLRRAAEEQPEQHREVVDTLDQMAADLDEFLSDVRELEEAYDRLPKREGLDMDEEDVGDELESLDERMAEWEEWFADSVDAITKLPDGFVPDALLAEEMNTIFEEIERQPRGETTEIATPIEEGAKALAEEVKEDFEMWMPHEPDSTRWVMEDPLEGAFESPDAELPSDLQDMVGDLIEEAEEFDEQADDVTGAWGGNIQSGWDIMDGPISSFAAVGKTGNQLPNSSEMGGRSGSGRRGRASGQMVGGESRGMEGRPTPARVTNEPYEQGMPEVLNMLDPHGATGGGKMTGAGRRGLQGGTPPDFVQDMDRLAEHQAILREQTQLLARQFEQRGRPLTQLQRAMELMEGAEQDYRDLRYEDAARQRKAALQALREVGQAGDRGMRLSLEQAHDLPADMREEIGSAADQAMPAGYEDLVGAYYRALSEQE